MVGLAGGFLAGGVASAFEVSLRREVALASGPVATVVQDLLSVGIYLMIATLLLPV